MRERPSYLTVVCLLKIKVFQCFNIALWSRKVIPVSSTYTKYLLKTATLQTYQIFLNVKTTWHLFSGPYLTNLWLTTKSLHWMKICIHVVKKINLWFFHFFTRCISLGVRSPKWQRDHSPKCCNPQLICALCCSDQLGFRFVWHMGKVNQ